MTATVLLWLWSGIRGQGDLSTIIFTTYCTRVQYLPYPIRARGYTISLLQHKFSDSSFLKFKLKSRFRFYVR